jgi:acetyl-CoA carboxylase biotin carboxyl carrier protein
MSVSHQVLSPLPGTFYRQSSPDAPPYKAPGDAVSIGDMLGLVEVMKQFSEVTSEVAGTLKNYAIENGDPVDPGQVLAIIEAD